MKFEHRSAYDRCIDARAYRALGRSESIQQVIDANLRRDEGEDEEPGDDLFFTDGLPDEYDDLRKVQRDLVMITKHTPLTEFEKEISDNIQVALARADFVLPPNTLPLFKHIR